MVNYHIQHIESQHLKAVVTDNGAVYTTYDSFANAAGYREAVGHHVCLPIGAVVELLAKGVHESTGSTLYVVSHRGRKHIIGENGLFIGHKEIESELSVDQLINKVERYLQVLKERINVKDEVSTDAPNELKPMSVRELVIEEAKKDVVNLLNESYDGYDLDTVADYGHLEMEFYVNRDKRTVVAVLDGRYCPIDTKLRGIAKCDPEDCFNVHIGKAIALRRALGLDVPAKYLRTPQPTEPKVGDIIHVNYVGKLGFFEGEVVGKNDEDLYMLKDGCTTSFEPDSDGDRIIDDSRVKGAF